MTIPQFLSKIRRLEKACTREKGLARARPYSAEIRAWCQYRRLLRELLRREELSLDA